MIIPIKLNLEINAGSEFSNTVTTILDANNQPVDLTTFTGIGKIRKAFSSGNSVALTVTLGGDGTVNIALSGNDSLTLEAGKYVFDIYVANTSNSFFKAAEGQVLVIPTVSRKV